MRIGIITFHRSYNCGAMLQAWALKKVLERMGHTVRFPIIDRSVDLPRFGGPRRLIQDLKLFPVEDLKRMRCTAFRCRHLPEINCPPEGFSDVFDLIVVGSDQVWNRKIYEDIYSARVKDVLCAKNLPASIRTISYAASYGDKPLPEEDLIELSLSLNRYSAISVRERVAREQLQPLTKTKIEEVLDPTLLIDPVEYDEIACGSIPLEPYLFMYTLSTSSFFIETARALACRLGVACVIAPCYQRPWFGAPKEFVFAVSPDRLVQYARHAKYVLAGSFHGTVMGLIFNKPTLSLRAQVDEFESRPAALLRRLGCSECLVNPTTPIEKMERMLRERRGVSQEKVRAFKNESYTWLCHAVEG